MGKQRRNQRKNAAMLDSDDTDSVSSSSTMRSEQMLVANGGGEEVQDDKDSVLDQSLDALFEKRGSTREKALETIIETFNSNLPHEFVEKKFATMLHQCLNSIKKGSAKEVALASHAIGLLALTVGSGKKAQEILEESVFPISEALKSRSESSKVASLLDCLAVITFVGGDEPEETDKCMQIMWQVVHPKLGPNVVATKPSPPVITAMVSAWSFLLTTMDVWTLDPKSWQGSISYFSTLLDKDDRSVRIAAGEALALIFEIGNLEKFSTVSKGSSESSAEDKNIARNVTHIQGLRAKILNQVRDLSAEAGGKGSAKKDLNNQRNTFRDILEFLEDGYSPETSVKIGVDSLATTTWYQLIQLNFLKRFLRGGFIKHMQENEFLHEVFEFTPKKKLLSSGERVSGVEKRMYKSPNSALNKARTQYLNKQRMLSRDKNAGHFASGFDE
uniref:interferon-related developmental regulator 1 n=1 Tax=Erigeron canadensis TaxID=72917 RepID=UPI001CB995DA|nr:interferon-related developmental regulator 1 [Erigeron canadensis]